MGKCWGSTKLQWSCQNASGCVWHWVGKMKILRNFALNSPHGTRCGRESGECSRKGKPGPSAWWPRMEPVWDRQPAKEPEAQAAIAGFLSIQQTLLPRTGTWQMRKSGIIGLKSCSRAAYVFVLSAMYFLITKLYQQEHGSTFGIFDFQNRSRFEWSKSLIKPKFESILSFSSHRIFSPYFHRSQVEIQDYKNNKLLSLVIPLCPLVTKSGSHSGEL